jgi:hypothetical protein
MKRKLAASMAAVLILSFGYVLEASGENSITVASGGVYPPGTSFLSVPLNGLESGFGVVIDDSGSATGEFCTILVGVSALGIEQRIIVEGKATAGSRSAANLATFSGTCQIDLGDGTPPLVAVPFTATITTDAIGQGTIGLVLGDTSLPAAAVNEGSMSIRNLNE